MFQLKKVKGITVVFSVAILLLSGCGGSDSGGGSSNLTVSAFSASPSSVSTNASIKLDYTVRNSGDASSELSTLTYYRSSDSNITTSDTKISDRNIIALSAGGQTSYSSNAFNAPATAGTYYYGACVAGSCSTGAQVVVTSSSSGGGGSSSNSCNLVNNTITLAEGKSCTYNGSTAKCENSRISYGSLSAGGTITLNGISFKCA